MTDIEFSSLRIAQLETKHTPPGIDTSKLATMRLLASTVGYSYSDVGSNLCLTIEEDRQRVREMAQCRQQRPIKVVITRDCRVWADNTHWSISCLLRLGLHARLGDVEYYIVDLRRGMQPNARIVGCPPSLYGSARALAINNAWAIQRRLDRGWRPLNLSYTLGALAIDAGYIDT